MRTQTLLQAAFAALGLGLVATAADAATVTIEPDNYVGTIGDVAPGAEMSTFRALGVNSYTKAAVYSLDVGAWAPTGTRVFGHRKVQPSETTYHWDNLSQAYHCEHFAICGGNFYVFRVEFDWLTNFVSVYTTMRGEQAVDPVELDAFDANGSRILRCRVQGVTAQVLASGALPPPRYFNGVSLGDVCGSVLEKKNCSGADPGNCDYVVQLNVLRPSKDIKHVMFGGPLWQNTWAPVDKLRYNIN